MNQSRTPTLEERMALEEEKTRIIALQDKIKNKLEGLLKEPIEHIELKQLPDEPEGNFRLIAVSKGLTAEKLGKDPIYML